MFTHGITSCDKICEQEAQVLYALQPSWLKRFNLDIVYPSYRFFEKNPEYQRLFPEFKDVPPEELEKTNALYGHTKRVMKAVENAVSALDDAESFSAYLDELGRRHKTRALKPAYLEVHYELPHYKYKTAVCFFFDFSQEMREWADPSNSYLITII